MEYEAAIKELQTEYRKGRKGGMNQALLKQLMEKTTKGRGRWIKMRELFFRSHWEISLLRIKQNGKYSSISVFALDLANLRCLLALVLWL